MEFSKPISRFFCFLWTLVVSCGVFILSQITISGYPKCPQMYIPLVIIYVCIGLFFIVVGWQDDPNATRGQVEDKEKLNSRGYRRPSEF